VAVDGGSRSGGRSGGRWGRLGMGAKIGAGG
jgi:hypothetical protein